MHNSTKLGEVLRQFLDFFVTQSDRALVMLTCHREIAYLLHQSGLYLSGRPWRASHLIRLAKVLHT